MLSLDLAFAVLPLEAMSSVSSAILDKSTLCASPLLLLFLIGTSIGGERDSLSAISSPSSSEREGAHEVMSVVSVRMVPYLFPKELLLPLSMRLEGVVERPVVVVLGLDASD